jgi:hypothetical protein
VLQMIGGVTYSVRHRADRQHKESLLMAWSLWAGILFPSHRRG